MGRMNEIRTYYIYCGVTITLPTSISRVTVLPLNIDLKQVNTASLLFIFYVMLIKEKKK